MTGSTGNTGNTGPTGFGGTGPTGPAGGGGSANPVASESFLVGCAVYTFPSTKLIYSYDGDTWSETTTANNGEYYNVAWNGSVWVAAGDSPTNLARSSDGINWTDISGSWTLAGSMVGWNGNMWLAGGNTYPVSSITSGDETKWNLMPQPDLKVDRTVCWNGTIWVMGGDNSGSTIAYSYDAVNWFTDPSGGKLTLDLAVYDIAWNGRMFVAAGTQSSASIGFAYSYDGIVWALSPVCPIESGLGVAWNGSLWVGVGQKGARTATVATSVDGVHWTGQDVGANLFSSFGRSVTWNGKKWFVAGLNPGNRCLYSSTDGITWTGITLSTAAETTGLYCMRARRVLPYVGNTQVRRITETKVPVLDVSGTALTEFSKPAITTYGYGIYFSITNSGFNTITLPNSSVGDVGSFWVFRNNSGATLTITVTYTGSNGGAGTGTVSIAPDTSLTIVFTRSGTGVGSYTFF
jgi:hypothetical protein